MRMIPTCLHISTLYHSLIQMVPETSFTTHCLFSRSPSLFLWKRAVEKTPKKTNKQNWILFAKIVLKSSILVDHFACNRSGIQSLFSHFQVQWVPFLLPLFFSLPSPPLFLFPPLSPSLIIHRLARRPHSPRMLTDSSSSRAVAGY